MPDVHLVLTDWCDENEHGEMGYHTFHFADAPHSSTSLCREDGLSYAYYSSMLSHEDDFLCPNCIRIAETLFQQLIEDNGELW